MGNITPSRSLFRTLWYYGKDHLKIFRWIISLDYLPAHQPTAIARREPCTFPKQKHESNAPVICYQHTQRVTPGMYEQLAKTSIGVLKGCMQWFWKILIWDHHLLFYECTSSKLCLVAASQLQIHKCFRFAFKKAISWVHSESQQRFVTYITFSSFLWGQRPNPALFIPWYMRWGQENGFQNSSYY